VYYAKVEDQPQHLNISPRDDTRNLRNLFRGRSFVRAVWYDIKKLIGLVITALAVSLGTDFWFNLLRNLTGRGGSQTVQPQKNP
jgi:hypothetical protein